MKKKMNEAQAVDHWNQSAELWAQGVRSEKDVFRDLFNNPEFLKFIGDIKGKKVLDIGCGEGYNTRIFAKLGAYMTGIDLSENMIWLAQEEENKNPLGISYQIASFTNLSELKDDTFDAVLSTMALMDGPGYDEAVKEFYRVLKPRGELFFSIIHPCFLTPHYKSMLDENGEWKQIVGNYFKEQPWEFAWTLAKKADKSDALPFVSLSYHRTLSTYINDLIKAGFTLKRIIEPRPTIEAVMLNHRLERALQIPSFLYVHAIK